MALNNRSSLTFALCICLCLLLGACSDDNVTALDGAVAKDGPVKDLASGPDKAAPKPDKAAPKPDKATPTPDKAAPKLDQPVVVKPDMGGSTACKPFCDKIGSKSEGWYDSCTKVLIKWDQCAKCSALCKDCGPGCWSNGWYNGCTGKVIKYTTCQECKPVCKAIGSYSEGWYNSCTGKLLNHPTTGKLFYAQCAKCSVVCQNFGLSTNGYYSPSCTKDMIMAGPCIP